MTDRADVVVVGGGTSGLQAALQLARVGCSVILLERRPEGRGGARWCNGVVPWQFDRAGLERPQPPELRGKEGAAHMVSPSGRHRFTIDESPIWEADMRELVDRLGARAAEAGVEVRAGVTDITLAWRDGRPVALDARQGDEGTLHLEADLFVDASGRAGVVRDQVPELAAWCPPSGPADLCSAQQLVLEVDDRDGARAYLEAEGALPGDAVVAVGMEGGFSTTSIKVETSLAEVAVLTGSIPALGHATGPEMLKAVRARHPWMGRPQFGGGGLIPLRRVYHRFTAPGVALVGDAASQVMAGHGSGIGFGLMAGKVLAEAVEGAVDPGHPAVLWRYQARYLREFGAILAAYDVVRRMSVKLGPEGVEAMYASGIFSPPLVLPGLEQKLGVLAPAEALDAARALATDPRMARVVLPSLNAMGMARALYRAYPTEPSVRALRSWARIADRLLPDQAA